MSQAVNDLLDSNLIEEIFSRRTSLNLFPFPRTARVNKLKVTLDLRQVNAFVYKRKFKCEDLSAATQIFDKGFSLFKFDFKFVYHHNEIFPEHRKFLAFAWDFSTGNFRYFQFCVLSFGLSSSPSIFTKMLKPLQKFWRSRGIPIANFLDDVLGGGADHISAKLNSLIVHSDLLKSGFVPNEDKSQWEPVQIITWLGVILNTTDGSVKATDDRIVKLTTDLRTFSPSTETRNLRPNTYLRGTNETEFMFIFDYSEL